MQPNLISLGLDTSTSHCSISIMSGNDKLAEINEQVGRNHAENLIRLIKQALKSAQLKFSDLNTIGVGVGPGNFTGIRISVATVLGLSFALKIPSFGITRYEAYCFEQEKDAICSIDSINGHVYLISYIDGNFGLCSMHKLEKLPKGKNGYVIGDQSKEISKKLNLIELEPIYSPATSVAKIAQKMPSEKSPPKPFYPNSGIYGTFDELNSAIKS